MENRRYDPLDAILDAALNSYAEAEPLTGLEERILNRAYVAQSKIRVRGLSLLAIGGAALALFCLFFAGVEQKRIEQKTNPQKAIYAHAGARLESHIPSPLPVQPRISLPRPRQAQIRHPRSSPRQLPKREQFPTPQPPSAEELAMLRFIERNPQEAAQAFVSLQREADKPLEIEPLDIKPLQMDGVNH